MIDAGVRGFLIKNVTKDTLEKAIQIVFNGGNYYSEELFQFFARQLHPEPAENPVSVKMTRREEEILQLIALGLNNREIAEKLFVSERTVVGHKSNLLSKTGCKNTISLLAWAIRNDLVNI
jgi:DNA-binding NarL/FixJ family response regulator